MTGPSAPAADPVLARLDELAGMFRRRLADDSEKPSVLDALYGELAAVRAAAEGQVVLPLVRRLIVLIDRLDAAGPALGQSGSDLAGSVTAELCEALHAQDVSELDIGEEFDPATQEAMAAPGPAGTRPGMILGVRRRGWWFQGRVLRPALVEIADRGSG